MRVAIVFSFTAPLVIYSLIYSAAMQGKTLGLHEEYALYVCLGNIASVIAYGFGGPPAIQRAKKKLGDVLKIGKKRDQ